METIGDGDAAPSVAVAVAASAGGVEALTDFVSGLPADFGGAVLALLHMPPAGPSVLAGILARSSRLPVSWAEDGMHLKSGHIVVATPGKHLLVHHSRVRLDPGPRQNGFRPSADALFRSVARSFGPRGAGVVLSGTMDDGAAGLLAIGQVGGLTIAQDPAEAAFPGMPRAAIAEAGPDLVCAVGKMGQRLSAWLSSLPPLPGRPEAAARRHDDMSELSPFTCPECGGTLWLDEFSAERFRCRVGHTFSPRSLLVGKDEALEAALWAAIVALEERADLSRRILKRLEGISRPATVQRYRDDIDLTAERIGLLRGLIAELVNDELMLHGAEEDDPNPTA